MKFPQSWAIILVRPEPGVEFIPRRCANNFSALEEQQMQLTTLQLEIQLQPLPVDSINFSFFSRLYLRFAFITNEQT